MSFAVGGFPGDGRFNSSYMTRGSGYSSTIPVGMSNVAGSSSSSFGFGYAVGSVSGSYSSGACIGCLPTTYSNSIRSGSSKPPSR